MEKKIAGLFDLDGVVFDTETQYDVFWGEQGRLFHPEIDRFNKVIKGRTLKRIFDEYFPDEKQQIELTEKIAVFENQMTFPFIPGVQEFIADLKRNGTKVAIVTSSDDAKMTLVYRARPEIREIFDVIIAADKIKQSKPDPECYLLAAAEVGIAPRDCYVFEDSFSGLEAGRRAAMNVIGIATTWPEGQIRDKADRVIPDFVDMDYWKLVN